MKVYEHHIRELLLKELVQIEEFAADPNNIVISELDVCFGISRVDMAVVNGQLHGFEIKSEQDTLARLSKQIESYNKVFDTVTIVVAENHIREVAGRVPKYWGIYSVVKNEKEPLRLKKERLGNANHKTDPYCLAQFLWKRELLELIGTKGTKGKTRFALCSLVANTMKKGEIRDFVIKTLKSREGWRAVPIQQLCDDLLQ